MIRLVVTHGRDQPFVIPATEAREWEEALRRGLERVGAPYYADIPISFAFYGDLWRPDTPGGLGTRSKGGIMAADQRLRLEFATELAAKSGVAMPKRPPKGTRGLWDPLAAVVSALDDRFGVGEIILQNFLKDVAQYFQYDDLRRKVMDRVSQTIKDTSGPVVLLGHSMGSIVGYDLLMRQTALPVHALVTFGSPIGTATCRKHVANSNGKTPFPPKLPRWLNLYYREDIATVVRLLAPLFPSSDERGVEDREIVGRPAGLENLAGGHDPIVYLSSLAMGESVRAVVDEWNAAHGETSKPQSVVIPATRGARGVSRATSTVGRGTKGAAKAAPAKKAWTVLVWIAGDNNLDEFGLADIREMKKVGSNAAVDIVVQFDRMGNGKTNRYNLRKGTKLSADVVGRLGETNTGDPAVAIDFFTWGMQTYPSDKVLAVIWNHGSGIDEENIYARAARALRSNGRPVKAADDELTRGQLRSVVASKMRHALFITSIDAALHSRAIAYDDTSRDFLDNAELKTVLTQVVEKTRRPIDVLGMDACLMNMLEVAYQLRGQVGHIVASEETEPGNGWPYDKVMAALAARPAAIGRDVASMVVKQYLSSYGDSDNVTNSAVDVGRVGLLAQTVDNLASVCIASLESNDDFAAFGKSLLAAQRYQMRDFVDLGDLCQQLMQRSSRPAVQQAARQVLDSLGSGSQPFVVAEGHKGQNVSGSKGTAIYFPIVGDVHLTYDQLDFARDTRWGELIAKYKQV